VTIGASREVLIDAPVEEILDPLAAATGLRAGEPEVAGVSIPPVAASEGCTESTIRCDLITAQRKVTRCR